MVNDVARVTNGESRAQSVKTRYVRMHFRPHSFCLRHSSLVIRGMPSLPVFLRRCRFGVGVIR